MCCLVISCHKTDHGPSDNIYNDLIWDGANLCDTKTGNHSTL